MLPTRALQAIPANLTRYGLSQIINHLLALGGSRLLPPPPPAASRGRHRRSLLWLHQTCTRPPPPPPAEPTRPFDFLIDGELLRLSLHKHLLAKSISAVRALAAACSALLPPALLPPALLPPAALQLATLQPGPVASTDAQAAWPFIPSFRSCAPAAAHHPPHPPLLLPR